MTRQITITRPDDWHLHFRDGAMLQSAVPFTARQFRRAIVMPNLVPPVTTVDAARAYRDRINMAVPDGIDFQPLMTAYLTDTIDAGELARGAEEGVFTAVKLYPAGATTNSDSGVTDLKKVTDVLECMQAVGLPLLLHGEVTDPEVDIFDREAAFLDTYLDDIVKNFPNLKVVLEHITTKAAADFVEEGPANLGATITPQHLLFNRNHMLAGGIRPHYYCLPILKRGRDQNALLAAATSGNPKFFLGSDSAPHVRSAKEACCGCAGCPSRAPSTRSSSSSRGRRRCRRTSRARATRAGSRRCSW